MTENNTNYVGLTCKECGKPIDIKTAIHTPTGYICKDCRNQRSKAFSTSKPLDFVVAAVLAFLFSAISAFLIQFVTSFIGYFRFIIIFAATPFIGKLLANLLRAATGKRRSNKLFIVATVATAIGAILPLSSIIVALFTGGFQSLGLLITAIAPLLYAIMLTSSTYFYLSGRRIKF